MVLNHALMYTPSSSAEMMLKISSVHQNLSNTNLFMSDSAFALSISPSDSLEYMSYTLSFVGM